MKSRSIASFFSSFVSLPSRERGLKYSEAPSDRAGAVSLPSRERGLKCKRESNWHDCGWSLPSRERGLKYNGGRVHNGCIGVAPLAGAWIEMVFERRKTPS